MTNSKTKVTIEPKGVSFEMRFQNKEKTQEDDISLGDKDLIQRMEWLDNNFIAAAMQALNTNILYALAKHTIILDADEISKSKCMKISVKIDYMNSCEGGGKLDRGVGMINSKTRELLYWLCGYIESGQGMDAIDYSWWIKFSDKFKELMAQIEHEDQL